MARTKICSRCGKEKSLSEFSKQKKGKQGRTSWCKKCKNEKARVKYREEHKKPPVQLKYTKVCIRCGREKILSEFYKSSSAKDGRHSWCCQCTKEYDAEYSPKYREKNREKIRTRDRTYYLNNKELFKDKELRRRFGISLADYKEILELQGGVCIICGRTPEENGKQLCVDHDHQTGEVRGLLCTACNRAIGNLRDSSEICGRAMLYLESYGR